MLYLSDQDIRKIDLDWAVLVDSLQSVVSIIDAGDYAQPVKPYLRYRNPQNRIIAMPAYVGGNVEAAGIKWISSFPGNLKKGLPRAHSIIVLNEPLTGQPTAVLNSSLPSIVRTAAISGLMIRHFMQTRTSERIQLGIIGWGPIGQYQLRMAAALYGDQIERIRIFDLREVDLSGIEPCFRDKIEVAESWADVYCRSNIFITCTVSQQRYIDRKPVKGSLLLNVSLRDYKPEALASVRAIVVDDWDEVCRENTDIEQLHIEQGLNRTDIRTMTDVVLRNGLAEFDIEEPVFFCPMGMAVFDIATAVYFVKGARDIGVGYEME